LWALSSAQLRAVLRLRSLNTLRRLEPEARGKDLLPLSAVFGSTPLSTATSISRTVDGRRPRAVPVISQVLPDGTPPGSGNRSHCARRPGPFNYRTSKLTLDCASLGYVRLRGSGQCALNLWRLMPLIADWK
jgi:hypothetical protein